LIVVIVEDIPGDWG